MEAQLKFKRVPASYSRKKPPRVDDLENLVFLAFDPSSSLGFLQRLVLCCGSESVAVTAYGCRRRAARFTDRYLLSLSGRISSVSCCAVLPLVLRARQLS
jgi:hypothetical protein